MNEGAKKGLLIVVIIVAVAIAGFGAMKMFSGDQQQVVETLPGDPNFKSEKQLAVEGQAGAGNSAAGQERDLSGAL